jgi:hypothetical protein
LADFPESWRDRAQARSTTQRKPGDNSRYSARRLCPSAALNRVNVAASALGPNRRPIAHARASRAR